MRTYQAAVLLSSLVLLPLGCGGESPTGCEQATERVQVCLGIATAAPADTCDPAAAERILAMDCDEIKAGMDSKADDGWNWLRRLFGLPLVEEAPKWTLVLTVVDSVTGRPFVGKKFGLGWNPAIATGYTDQEGKVYFDGLSQSGVEPYFYSQTGSGGSPVWVNCRVTIPKPRSGLSASWKLKAHDSSVVYNLACRLHE